MGQLSNFCTFEFNNFDREIFFAHPEYFQIAEDRLLRLGVPIDLDTKVVTEILPVKFTLYMD